MTLNDAPSAARSLGTAPSDAGACSSIAVAAHASSTITPPCPAARAFADVKATVPKSASANVRQRSPELVHADGASAIHSAEDTSGDAMKRRFVKDVFRVRFFSCTMTRWPLTVTFAEILLPGKTLS